MNLKEFANPTKQYRPLPVWEWNAEIESSEVETQIRELNKKGFGGFIIHAANGLNTKYLGDDWMKAFRRAIEVANELKIEAWFSDEDRGPSGFAGGATTYEKDEFVQAFLIWEPDASKAEKPAIDSAVIYVVKDADGKFVSTAEKPENLSEAGIFYTTKNLSFSPDFNGGNFPDLMNPEAVQNFIENTHEKYLKLFRYDFGENMPGIYTNPLSDNSPDIENGKTVLPWSPSLPEYFQNTFGYSLTDNLHKLLSDKDSFKFRNDYYQAVTELFDETFTTKIQGWCKEHGLMLAGTFENNDSVNPLIQYISSDILSVEIPDIAKANVVRIKELAGIANQLGKKRLAGKILSNMGNSLSLDDVRKIVDFISALGVNSINPVNMRYSMLGVSKDDLSPSFSYHHPGWDKMRGLTDYMARCSWVASQGKSAAHIGLLSPMESSSGIFIGENPDTGEVQKIYSSLVKELIAEQIEFDICQESVIENYGIVENNNFYLEKTAYDCIIIPPSLSWKKSTLELLGSFKGIIILIDEPSVKIKDDSAQVITELKTKDNSISIKMDKGKIAETVNGKLPRSVTAVFKDNSKPSKIIVNHRIEAAAHIVMVSTPAAEEKSEVTITVNALGGVIELDPATGRAYRYDSKITDGKTIIDTVIHPYGSRIFLIDQTQTTVLAGRKMEEEKSFSISGPYSYKLLADNCLTLDKCNLRIDGKVLAENESVSKVKQLVWEKTGLADFIGYQPWAMKENNVRTRTNKTVLTFSFTVKEKPETIALAMETSDRYTVEINGNKIDFTPGRWFIDRRIRVLNLEDHIVEGENIITATTDYLWDTQIENIYIIGDFALGAAGDEFPIIKQPETVEEGDWGTQGFPFYTGSMLYKMNFSIEKDVDARYEMDLSGLKATLTSIRINDEEVGIVPFSPFRGDITGALKSGENAVELELTGSLANAFSKPVMENGVERRVFVPYGIIGGPRLIILK